ncbi:MAG: PAS-domain containing protein [Pseudomonadota bacterium]
MNLALKEQESGQTAFVEIDPMLEDIFEGADTGLALFDENLNLIRANEAYLRICEYEDIPAGTPLREMMISSLRRANHSEGEIEGLIASAMLRLKVGGTYKFRFETPGGRLITISRNRTPSGRLIETVQEVDAQNGQADPTNENGDTGGTDGRFRIVAEMAHKRMIHAMNSMADGFALYDPDDRLVTYNQRYVDLNPGIRDLIKPGANYEKMLRTHVERDGFDCHGMDKEAFINWRLHQHYNPGEPHEYKLSDGRWVRVQERQTEDGSIVGIRSDITELKNREIEIEKIATNLNTTNDRFNEALNNMIQGLCMFDADQKLILCNRQYLKMYGFSDEVVKPGIAIPDIMRYSISLGNYRDEDAQAALKARHDRKVLKERTIIKQYLRDGRVIAVMNEPMANGGSIATYEDITELERNSSQLLEHTRKLEESNRELQDFAFVASHDLQEPLRKIEAFGDRLVKKYGEMLPDDGQLYIDRMQNAASRMRSLINDLLSYSRVTTKAKPFEEVDLGEILNGVSDLQIRLQESNGSIEIGDMPTFFAEPTQMRQLFQNLLSNALKFKKPDVDPIVTISAERIEITDDTGTAEGFHDFTLRDNGIGFENEYKHKIFTIFQRLHGKTEYEGTGIGLATCRKIVERHNGMIDANGETGVGATFTIRLPEKQTQPEE